MTQWEGPKLMDELKCCQYT